MYWRFIFCLIVFLFLHNYGGGWTTYWISRLILKKQHWQPLKSLEKKVNSVYSSNIIFQERPLRSVHPKQFKIFSICVCRSNIKSTRAHWSHKHILWLSGFYFEWLLGYPRTIRNMGITFAHNWLPTYHVTTSKDWSVLPNRNLDETIAETKQQSRQWIFRGESSPN